jgi:hypothetical protein
VEEAYQCFRREGHPAQFWKIPGLGHSWAREQGINRRIWEYLSQHRLP